MVKIKFLVVFFILAGVLSCKNEKKEKETREKWDLILTNFFVSYYPIRSKSDFQNFLRFVEKHYEYKGMNDPFYLLTLNKDSTITIAEKNEKWYEKKIKLNLDLEKVNLYDYCNNLQFIGFSKDFSNLNNDDYPKSVEKTLQNEIIKTLDSTAYIYSSTLEKSFKKSAIFQYKNKKTSILCKKGVPKHQLGIVQNKIDSILQSQQNATFDYVYIPVVFL
ncbi:hypothetical protein [Aquimarina longa]|uniref:hypothetical protein n=1 Tax=Aquimarina longa TaxID=1080221 RepID=UPI000B256DAD|nr:hypothetical protein [Aquimarina longa]